MVDSRINVPRFALPLQLGVGGTFACVEQDSEDEIAQAVFVLLSTPLGSQLELPEYGYEDQTFGTTVNVSAAQAAVESWEPRATIDVTAEVDSLDDLVEHIRINVNAETIDDA